MAYYGRRVTAGDFDYGIVGQNQQRTSVYNKSTENGWAHKIGMWGGRVSGYGAPTVKMGVWSTSGLTPATLLASHGGIALNTYQTAGTNGQAYEVSVTPFKMYSNTNYAIGFVSTGTIASHSMIQAASINAENEQFYHRDGVTAPTNPNGYTYSANEGWMSMWIEYQPNRGPSAAASSPSGLITTTSPTFSGTFYDADSVYGDKPVNFRIQVVRTSDGALMWDTGNTPTNGTEQANWNFSRGYGGSALAAGVQYQWQVAVADDFGAWSAWSGWTYFTVNGGGAVTPGTPSTKQNTLQPSPFSATWSHASALAMNAVQVRILQGGSVIRDGAEVAKAASNGAGFTTTWAEQFGGYALNWGVGYQWQIRGRDTGSLWSNWSSAQSFSTNNPPDVPYNLAPTNSTPSSSRPLLTATATDADGDTVTVKARIKNNAGTVLYTRTMTRIGTTNNYQYQTTSTDLATTATYKWDAYSYDGSLYSGAQTLEANAVKSSEAAFIYGAGPVVTITGPSTTVTTATPSVTWTATDQQKYQVILKQGLATVYDSGLITSATQSHIIPSGVLREGQSYDLTVSVTNSAPLTGTSNVRTFLVDFPTPASVTNFHASPEYQDFDMAPSSIRLTWDVSTDPNFLEYLITRSDGAETLLLARISTQSQSVFIDYHPESGVEYDYSIAVATLFGLDVLVSDEVHTQSSVALQHVVLADVLDGGNNRIGLHFDEDRGISHVDDLVLEHPWGQNAPTGVYGTAQYITFSGTFRLITNDYGSARQHIEALRSLWRSRATISYRDERGRKFFGKIRKFAEKDNRIQSYTVDLDIVEIGHEEGVH